jgi:hypothetical protein
MYYFWLAMDDDKQSSTAVRRYTHLGHDAPLLVQLHVLLELFEETESAVSVTTRAPWSPYEWAYIRRIAREGFLGRLVRWLACFAVRCGITAARSWPKKTGCAGGNTHHFCGIVDSVWPSVGYCCVRFYRKETIALRLVALTSSRTSKEVV